MLDTWMEKLAGNKHVGTLICLPCLIFEGMLIAFMILLVIGALQDSSSYIPYDCDTEENRCAVCISSSWD